MKPIEEKSMSKKKRKTTKWIKFARVLIAIQAILSIIVTGMVIKTQMLPAKFLIPMIILFVVALLLVFALVYVGQNRKHPTKSCYLKRGLGTFIAVLIIAVCVFATSVLGKLLGTIGYLTGDKETVEEKVGVYVMDDDPAKTINDAADYEFGISQSYGYEDTKEAIDDINKKLGSEIATKEYDTALDMVDALYSGKTKAMIINESYESIISDTEGYEDFTSKTRIIYEYTKTYEVEKTQKDVKVTKEPFAVYISGSDTREAKLAKSRSDVNILAFVNPVSKQVLLLNTPRDYYINISIAPDSKDKLTHCGLYGLDCSMDTLADLYGIDSINYYAQINFTGFETLIDEIGGVTVYSDASFTSSDYPDYKYVKGENELNGSEALAFVRERYNLGDGDYARGRHQMAVISAVIDKMTSSTTLLTNYSGIMDSLEGMISTDFESGDISALINMQLSDGGGWDVKSYTVVGEGTKGTTYSMPKFKAYVTIPDEESVDKAKGLIKKVMNGETITDSDVE